MNRAKSWPRLATVVLVAFGLIIAWGAATTYLVNWWQARFASQPNIQERILVERSGRPLVMSSNYSALGVETFRTLDGETTKLRRRPAELYAVDLPDPAARTWRHLPPPWYARMSLAGDLRDFPGSASWFMLKSGDRMYFEGFDDASRMRIGYLGRTGFRTAPPPADECFAMPSGAPIFTQATGRSLNTIGPAPYLEDSESSVVPWCVYLLDGHSLAEVNLRERSVRTVLDNVDALSISIIAKAVEAQGREPDAARDDSSSADQGGETVELLALRLPDRILLLDPRADQRMEFVLPPQFQKARNLYVYGTAGDQIVLQIGQPYSTMERTVELAWIDRAGRVLESRDVALAGQVPISKRAIGYQLALIGPVPFVWAAWVGAFEPFIELEELRAVTYAEAIREHVAHVWPGLALVGLAAVASALAVFRWQREYHRPHTAAWVAAALLVGPALVAAYYIEHRGEARAACPACGRIVPRTREACAACGDAFPAPRLLGTEVFA